MPVHRLFTTTHRGGRSGFPKKGLDAGFAGAGAEIRYIPIENCDIWSNFIISFQTIFILITNYLVISELPSTLVGKSYLMPLYSLYVLLLLEICTTRQDFQLSHTTATGLCHIRDSFIHLYSHIIVCTVISQSCRHSSCKVDIQDFLLNTAGTVCPNMSCFHCLCLFSQVASRLSSLDVPSHDFHCNICSACAVTVVICGHLRYSLHFTYLQLCVFGVFSLVCEFSVPVQVIAWKDSYQR